MDGQEFFFLLMTEHFIADGIRTKFISVWDRDEEGGGGCLIKEEIITGCECCTSEVSVICQNTNKFKCSDLALLLKCIS